jgi:tRNA(His) guanylyltransferase
MNEDSLGDRMKSYEDVFRQVLPNQLPVILRVDGRAFHSYTRGCEKPFDRSLMEAMDQVALDLCSEINNAVMAYVQSDEISVLVVQKSKDSQPWFGGNLQKMCSVAASKAAVRMTMESPNVFPVSEADFSSGTADVFREACFDARAFVLPPHEVQNYFVWRQQDWVRNSISMLTRAHYSHKEMDGKSQSDMHEMLYQKNVNWADLSPDLKNGRVVVKREVPIQIPAGPKRGEIVTRSKWGVEFAPIFTANRNFIEQLMWRDA